MTPLDRAAYLAECRLRWGGPFLADARSNWADFEHLHPTLQEALAKYHRDPFLTDMAGKCHNPDGTLSAMLWKLQEAIEPSRS